MGSEKLLLSTSNLVTSDDLRRASFTPQWLVICLNLRLSSAISFKHPSTSPPWANVLVWEHKSKLLFVEGKVPKSSLGFAVIVWVLLKNAGELTAWRQPTGRKAWNKKKIKRCSSVLGCTGGLRAGGGGEVDASQAVLSVRNLFHPHHSHHRWRCSAQSVWKGGGVTGPSCSCASPWQTLLAVTGCTGLHKSACMSSSMSTV